MAVDERKMRDNCVVIANYTIHVAEISAFLENFVSSTTYSMCTHF